jgi:hypothetical protein
VRCWFYCEKRQQVSPKRWYLSTRLHGVTSEKTALFLGTSIRISCVTHIRIFLISVFNQLDSQNLFHSKFYFMLLHVSSTCAHHQEVKIALHNLWYHHTCRWPSHARVERGLMLVKYWDKYTKMHGQQNVITHTDVKGESHVKLKLHVASGAAIFTLLLRRRVAFLHRTATCRPLFKPWVSLLSTCRKSSCVSNFYSTFMVFIWLSLVHICSFGYAAARVWGEIRTLFYGFAMVQNWYEGLGVNGKTIMTWILKQYIFMLLRTRSGDAILWTWQCTSR